MSLVVIRINKTTFLEKQMKYTSTHEWIKIIDEIATVGISYHAQEQLSDVVYVDFPEIGAYIRAGESFMTIESVKAASDIYAPVSGEILEINKQLSESPELVNESPEEKGWLVKIKYSSQPDAQLLDKDAYLDSISEK